MRASERLNAMIAEIPRIDWRKVRTYDWERRHVHCHSVAGFHLNTIQHFQRVVDEATECLEISPAKCVLQHKRTHPACRYFHRKILVGPSNLMRAVAYHETAHLFVMSKAHNEKWIHAYIRLLWKLGGIDATELWNSYRREVLRA